MLRYLLAGAVSAIPLMAMAQSPWATGSPTYVGRGALIPSASRTEYLIPVQALPAPSTGSSLFAVDALVNVPVSASVTTAMPTPGAIMATEASPSAVPQMTSPVPQWSPTLAPGSSWECGGLTQCGPQPQYFWVRAEQLFWRLDNGRLPPLVTTAPSGADLATAGAIGANGTRVLFGGTDYLDEYRSGYRFSAGGWLTADQTLGIEASYFSLEGDSVEFSAGTPRYGIVASTPFINAITGQSQRVLVGYPGVVNGAASVNYEADRLWGFDVVARVLLSNQVCGRVDGLIGYRQINYGESLSIRDTIIPDPNGPIPVVPGSSIQAIDGWRTSTNFAGLNLGLNWEIVHGSWSFVARPRVTIGHAEQIVDRSGSTVIDVPGVSRDVYTGSFYNLDSNIGRVTKTSWTAVPELDLQIGHNICEYVRIFGGYSCLYLTQVARAGNQIDPVINPDLIPPVQSTAGPLVPEAPINRSGMLIQGFSVGLEIRY